MDAVNLSSEGLGHRFDLEDTEYLWKIRPSGAYQTSPQELEARAWEDATHRIRVVEEGKERACYIIDGHLQVFVPSPDFRSQAVQHWETKKSSYRNKAWLATVAAISLVASSIGVFLERIPESLGNFSLQVLRDHKDLSAGIFGLIGIISAIYARSQFGNSNQSSARIDFWKKDPALHVALLRTKAYQLGFPCVYYDQLLLKDRFYGQEQKGTFPSVLLASEVEFLFDRYFDSTCTQLCVEKCVTDSQKKEWLDRFRSLNPLSQNALCYAYGRIPEKYAALSQVFETIDASLAGVQSKFDLLRASRRQDYLRTMNTIREQRALALAVPKLVLEQKLYEARKEREDVSCGKTYTQRQNEFIDKESKYHTIYMAAILPINFYFEQKQTEAYKALEEVLASIAKEQNRAFGTYYDYARGLVLSAVEVKRGTSRTVIEPFVFEERFRVPNFPKIEIRFVPASG